MSKDEALKNLYAKLADTSLSRAEFDETVRRIEALEND